MPRELRPCGTDAAWQRHKHRGEQPCEACCEAHRRYVRTYFQDHYSPGAEHRFPQPAVLDHGSISAYQRHQRRGEVPCAECKAAAAKYKREYNARRRAEQAA